MSLDNLTNLFEVTKTVHFELRPSNATRSRIKFDDIKEVSKFIDPDVFFEEIEPVASLFEKMLPIWKSGNKEGILFQKDFIQHLNPRLFKENKGKWKSGDRYFVDPEKEDQKQQERDDNWSQFKKEFECQIQTFEESLSKIRLDLQILRSQIPTKADKIRLMKRYANCIKHINKFFGFFRSDSTVSSNTYTEDLKAYNHFQIEKKELLFACDIIFRSLSVHGIERWKSGLNVRGLDKKPDKEKKEKEVEFAKSSWRELQDKKDTLASKISAINNDPIIAPKRSAQEALLKERGLTGTKFSRAITDWMKDIYPEFKKCKEEKDRISKRAGEAKQKYQALEQELYNQEKLSHFARILRKDNKYFFVLADRGLTAMKIEKLSEGNGYEALTYNSLTFQALEKWTHNNDKCTYEQLSWMKKDEREDDKLFMLRKEKLLVDFFKPKLLELNKQEGNQYDLNLNELKEVTNLEYFKVFVNENCYRTTWIGVNENQIHEMDEKGEIMFFQIYSQDFPLDKHFVRPDNERDANCAKKEHKTKVNIFTEYWRDTFERNLAHIHITPESRIYLRPPQEEYVNEEGKSRFKEGKVIADFGIVFYPTKKTAVADLQQKIIKEITSEAEVSYIGIDRGNNSLANYMILDKKGNIRRDNKGNPLKGDMTLVNTKGEFVDIRDCVWGDEKAYRLIKNLFETDVLRKLIGSLPNWTPDKNIPFDEKFRKLGNLLGIKETDMGKYSFEDLQKFQDLLQNELNPKSLKLRDKGYLDKTPIVWVFDYAYAMNHLRLSHRITYEMWMRKEAGELSYLGLSMDELGQKKILSQLANTSGLRKGYVSAFVSHISRLIVEHNAFVVFENLNEGEDENKEDDYLSGVSQAGLTHKEQAMLRGTSVYQMIEEKLIYKLNYLRNSNQQVSPLQLTPKIPNLGILQNTEKLLEKPIETRFKKEESKAIFDATTQNGTLTQIGNIIYISAENTSKICPNPKCGEKLERNRTKNLCEHTPKALGKNGCEYSTNGIETYGFDFITSGDELAAYNIAMRGIEFIDTGGIASIKHIPSKDTASAFQPKETKAYSKPFPVQQAVFKRSK